MKIKAIVLLSGGIDSTTCLFTAIENYDEVTAITFQYGQRHIHEISQAIKIARYAKVQIEIVTLILPILKSSLTNLNIDVPHGQAIDPNNIPNTYVPGRNTMFLSIAASVAESLNYDHIIIGANNQDYSGYPDCRPQFINAFNDLLKVNSKRAIEDRPIRVRAPLMTLYKVDIIKLAISLGVPLGLTTSCYDPCGMAGDQVIHCGTCDSCQIRKRGFEHSECNDPTIYKVII